MPHKAKPAFFSFCQVAEPARLKELQTKLVEGFEYGPQSWSLPFLVSVDIILRFIALGLMSAQLCAREDKLKSGSLGKIF